MDFIVRQKGFWAEDDESVLKAIHEGFIQTHYAMWKELGMSSNSQENLIQQYHKSNFRKVAQNCKRSTKYSRHNSQHCVHPTWQNIRGTRG